jgi:sialate O-acetylesterase
VQGDTIVLPSDGQPVRRVRYAWGDTPSTNLSDEADLPVGTFEVGVQ